MTTGSDDFVIPFADRKEAGRALAHLLATRARDPATLILALPRGGVPVAWEVARKLKIPLDVLIVRKLGHPGFPELAMGAIASGGATVINPMVVATLTDPETDLRRVISIESEELKRRETLYRQNRPGLVVKGKTVILVDDGLATGATMKAAAQAVRSLGAARCIAAAPVGSHSACKSLAEDADEVVCAHIPSRFQSVGSYYQDFTQTTDEEVRDLLSRDPRVSN